MKDFFNWSDSLEENVTRRLRHIKPNWELMWSEEKQKYIEEEDRFAQDLNILIKDLTNTTVPISYHDNEDIIAEYYNGMYDKAVMKIGKIWNVADYGSLLEQGAFRDINQEHLIIAARGRIDAAIKFGQNKYDEMESGHRFILGEIIANILYHRENDK